MRTEDGKPRPIEWTATIDGTMIGTGCHLHPGGYSVLTENMGSEENPCPDDGRGSGGTLLLKSDVINRNAPLSEDYQTEVTHPRGARRSTRATGSGSPATTRTRSTPGTRR